MTQLPRLYSSRARWTTTAQSGSWTRGSCCTCLIWMSCCSQSPALPANPRPSSTTMSQPCSCRRSGGPAGQLSRVRSRQQQARHPRHALAMRRPESCCPHLCQGSSWRQRYAPSQLHMTAQRYNNLSIRSRQSTQTSAWTGWTSFARLACRCSPSMIVTCSPASQLCSTARHQTMSSSRPCGLCQQA